MGEGKGMKMAKKRGDGRRIENREKDGGKGKGNVSRGSWSKPMVKKAMNCYKKETDVKKIKIWINREKKSKKTQLCIFGKVSGK